MTKATRWFFMIFSRLLGLLPHAIKYAFSDAIAFILHHLVRYRLAVVRQNLRNSFPELSANELKTLEKRFYRNLADLFVESLELISMDAKNLQKRIEVEDEERISNIVNRGKKLFIALSHSGNWEWFAVYLSLMFPGKIGSLYKEQSNKFFDKLFYYMRTRLGGLKLLESKSAYRLLSAGKCNVQVVLVIGDQTPGGKGTDHWTDFMHQPTPFFTGMEKMAQNLGFEVLFANILRTSRGRYKAIVEHLDLPKTPTRFPITEAYARRLELALKQNPDNWLWSHRRWKHKDKKPSL